MLRYTYILYKEKQSNLNIIDALQMNLRRYTVDIE